MKTISSKQKKTSWMNILQLIRSIPQIVEEFYNIVPLNTDLEHLITDST